MPKDAINSELETYLNTLYKYFSEEQASRESLMSNHHLKDSYYQLWEEKEKYLEKWDKLIAEIKQYPLRVRIRDMSHEVGHGFKVVLQLKNENKEKSLEGIIIIISLIGNYIGCYYADFGANDNDNPIITEGYRMGSITPVDVIHKDLSYFPFNDLQRLAHSEIISMVKKYFTEFAEFDNTYANYKVPQIESAFGFFKNIDLFQVLFSNNIHGII